MPSVNGQEVKLVIVSAATFYKATRRLAKLEETKLASKLESEASEFSTIATTTTKESPND